MEAEFSSQEIKKYPEIRKSSEVVDNNSSDFSYDQAIEKIQTLINQPPASKNKENVHFYNNNGWYIGKQLELATSLKLYHIS